MPSFLRAFLLLFSPLAFWTPALCAEQAPLPALVFDFKAEIPGHPGSNYLGLLQQIVPDLTMDGEAAVAAKAPPIPAIISFSPPASFSPVRITSLQVTDFKAEGRRMLAILFDLGVTDYGAEPPAILAIFDDGPSPRLVDAIDVGLDIVTSFADGPIDIGPNDQMLMTLSRHFKGGKEYGISPLMFMRNGKLQLIDPMFLFNDKECAFSRTQTLTATRHPADTRGPYDDIEISIVDAGFKGSKDCGLYRDNPAYSKTYTTLYQWDAGMGNFMANSDAMDALKDVTSDRL